jgi:hypothetical protein
MAVNFTGTWIADLSMSRFLGPMPKTVVIRIEHSDPELREEVLATKTDGGEERLLFQCSTNGEPDKSLLNGKPIRGTAQWQGDELVIESWMQFGSKEMHFCDHWSLGADTRTLTMEHRRGDLAGQITILDRAR